MAFSFQCRSLLSCLILNHVYKCLIHFTFVIYTLHYAQAEVEICSSVKPIQGSELENCSMECSLRFQHAVSSTNSDEITLCLKNSTAGVSCVNHNDCRQYHNGAYCKMIPCLCKIKSGPEAYIFDPFLGVHKINTCVVSAKYANPEHPIVPFPWQTLLVVCAIVLIFAGFLIFLRWISPLIRSMHAKRSSRNNRQRQAAPPEDNAGLFPTVNQPSDSTPFTYYFSQGLPRIYRASPRRSQRNHRSSSRTRYTACAQAEGTLSGTLSNEDKPPPYEAAIQLPPPAYEDVERAINESRSRTSSRDMTDQRVEVHATPDNIAPALPSSPPVS